MAYSFRDSKSSALINLQAPTILAYFFSESNSAPYLI